jgi:ribonuclease HI
VSPAAALKFPGWTPKLCSSCHREGAAGGQADKLLDGNGKVRTSSSSAGKRAGARRSGGARGGQPSIEEHLTLAEVLRKYSAGPDDGVFTDGSCMPNPGRGGWGAVYVRAGQVLAQCLGEHPDTTNNRMELEAIARGIELVPAGTPAKVYTDSRLCVDTLSTWAKGWAARGWKRKGGEVANLDVVKPLYEALLERPEIQLVWVKAHAGNRWNEYADSLATAWAREEL